MSSRLGGRYQLVAEIGAGGMGRVYQAIDTESGRAVAAKVMIAAEDNLDALLRFQQEGAVLATLRHPNIVEVYGAFLEMEQQTSCIIMELLEGRSLGQILRAERLSLSRAREIAAQVAAALTYAHGRGIVHRDIKPDNIMVVGNDHVKVTDFGIARLLRPGSTLNTVAGMSVGTPLYMSPEQIEGQKVDGRSDIYSLGAVMYEMTTGRPPFEGDDPLTIAFKHVHKAPDAPSNVSADVPPDWERVILKALSKDPGDRFQTASAFEDAILALPDEDGAAPRRPPRTMQSVERPPEVAPTSFDWPSSTSTGRSDAHISQGGTVSQPRGEDTRPFISEQPSTSGGERSGHQVTGSDPAVEHSAKRRRSRPALPWAVAAALVVVIVALGAFELLKPSGSSPAPPATKTATGGAFVVTQLREWGSSGTAHGSFRSPTDVAVDESGNIFVADSGNNRVQKLAASTKYINAWGQQGAEVTQYSNPWGVALDGHGNILIADTGNSRIQELSPSGNAKSEPWGSEGTGDDQFDHPSGIAIDAAGNIYVADTGNNRIEKLSPSGKYLNAYGSKGTGSSQFNHPTGIALDSDGDMFVADTGNNRVVELASSSDPLHQWGNHTTGSAEFKAPEGVAVDGQGNIYVTDTGNDRLVKLEQSGHVLFVAGKSGSGAGQFRSPAGIWVDSQGHIYVADSGNDRVQEVAVSRASGTK